MTQTDGARPGVRLLAHGGTAYSERHRIGEWPAIPRDALEATYGLPGESLIYGLGVLEDCKPFLVVRRRNVTDTGRSYAYSLLLDPGDEVWMTFEWNAAALLRALLEDEVCKQLLSQPEPFTREDLTASLRALRPPGDGDDHEDDAGVLPDEQTLKTFTDCWVGAAFADSPVAATPAAFGFGGRPGHAQIAGLLARIEQPCLRAGSGWLVGGSHEYGEAFGARLVLDEGASDESARLEATAGEGRRLLDAWAIVEKDEAYGAAARRLVGVPLCRWPGVEGLSGAATAERFRLLAELLSPGELREEFLRTLGPKLRAAPFLAAEIQSAAQGRLFGGGGELPGAMTELVVRNFFEHDMALGAGDVERLEEHKLIDLSVHYESESPKRLPLTPELRAEVYVRKMCVVEYEQLPALLVEAHEHLTRHFEGGRMFQKYLKRMVDALELRSHDAVSLRAWDAFPRAHAVWPQLKLVLSGAARARALRSGVGWHLDYLCYGDDEGGKHLGKLFADNSLRPERASLLIQSYVAQVKEKGELAAPARDWLLAMADTPLRGHVPVVDKVDVARAVGGRWLPLLALWASYTNDAPRSGRRDDDDWVGSEAQRKVLREELRQMLAEKPPVSFRPNLEGIARLVGSIPEKDLDKMMPRRDQPIRDANTIAEWASGLLTIGEKKRAAEALVRFALDSSERLPGGWLFEGFDRERLEHLAEHLLFRDASTEDGRYRRRCEEVLGGEGAEHEKLGRIFDKVYKEKIDQWAAENFARRYAWDGPALERLFAVLSPTMRDNAVRRLVKQDEDGFVEAFREIFEAVRGDDAAPLTPYRVAVLRHAQTCDPQLRKKLDKRRGFLARAFGEDDLDEALDSVLERVKKNETGGRQDSAEATNELTADAAREGEPNPAAEGVSVAARHGGGDDDARPSPTAATSAPPEVTVYRAGAESAAEDDADATPLTRVPDWMERAKRRLDDLWHEQDRQQQRNVDDEGAAGAATGHAAAQALGAAQEETADAGPQPPSVRDDS